MPVIYRSEETIDNLRPRINKDVYGTPYDLAFKSVELVANLYFPLRYPATVLDPGAGDGVWGDAVKLYYPFTRLAGVDIRRLSDRVAYDRWYPRTDYLKEFVHPTDFLNNDLIIGNPPFNLAEKFILKSRELLSEKGVLCFLLPSQFQHGQKRSRGLFSEYKPARIVSLAQRPNFTGPRNESLGTANTDDYILGIWEKESAKTTIHDWLDWKS